MGGEVIRKAKISDIKKLHSLINLAAKSGEVLPRSLSELYDNLRDYYVYVKEDDLIAGTGALHIIWEDLAEIKSIVVREEFFRQGIGTEILKACTSEAISLGIKKVFVLTYRPKFFERIGFKEVDKSVLPQKIWADCLKCAKFPDCDETALILEL